MGEIAKMKIKKCRTMDSKPKLIHKDLIRAIEQERKRIQKKTKDKVSSVYASKMCARRLLR